MSDPTTPTTQARPLPTFTITAILDDFPFTVEFSGSADQLAATVKRLREIGAVPPTPQARAAAAAEAARAAPACDCPECDKFGKAMTPSQKAPGTYYCTGRTGFREGKPVYCRSKA